VTPPPSATGPPPDSDELPSPPEFPATSRPWPGLDRLGLTQALGGVALGLIALFSAYDHITLHGRTLQLQQQWGIPFIAASVAIIVVDAQLATRSRLRAAQDAAPMADETARERHLAGEERQRADRERYFASEERQRADRERNRAAEAAERQGQATARLDRCALLSAPSSSILQTAIEPSSKPSLPS
jgi:hypothetical protein